MALATQELNKMEDGIVEIVKKIQEFNKKEEELKKEFSIVQNQKRVLTEKWQTLCSHPSEYQEVTNKYTESGTDSVTKPTDPANYTYKCTICGFIYNKEEENNANGSRN